MLAGINKALYGFYFSQKYVTTKFWSFQFFLVINCPIQILRNRIIQLKNIILII